MCYKKKLAECIKKILGGLEPRSPAAMFQAWQAWVESLSSTACFKHDGVLSDILPESCQWNVIIYGECVTVNLYVRDYNYNNFIISEYNYIRSK